MTLALRFAVRSDVGLLRDGNEDSAYAGPHLLAVADGMGGHAAGEIASAAVITTIATLDTEHAIDDLPGVIDGAVTAANLRLRELIRADSAIEGMGTTLTAIVWTDGHAAVGHVGDSRAYVLRDGRPYQITRDHTVVQSLLDQGKITEEEIATHPQRSVLVRALDGRTAVTPDVSVHETVPGDRYLLCSDGLSGVASERAIFATLHSTRDPDQAALRLIELAREAGGPDNITCVVADVVDTAASGAPPARAGAFAGAAANGDPGNTGPGSTGPGNAGPGNVGPGNTGPGNQDLIRTRPQPAVPDDDGGVTRSRSREPGRRHADPPVRHPDAHPDAHRDAHPGPPDEMARLRDRIAELEAGRSRHEAQIADIAETRVEVSELRAALAAQERELRELRGLRAELPGLGAELDRLRAELAGLGPELARLRDARDERDAGGEPSPGIASRQREAARTPIPVAKGWQPPPELADGLPATDGTAAPSTVIAGYAPRRAGYSGIGAGLLALGIAGAAWQREREVRAEDDGDDADD